MTVHIYENECVDAGLDPKALWKLARGLQNCARHGRLMGLQIAINTTGDVHFVDQHDGEGNLVAMQRESGYQIIARRLAEYAGHAAKLNLTLSAGNGSWPIHILDNPVKIVARLLPGFDKGDGSMRLIRKDLPYDGFPLPIIRLTKKQLSALPTEFEGLCAYCGTNLVGGWLPVEHSLEQQGESLLLKMMPACNGCHQSKGDLSLDGWRKLLVGNISHLNSNNPAYRIAKANGLIVETDKPMVFYFETVEAKCPASQPGADD